jgi:hypothetical protein
VGKLPRCASIWSFRRMRQEARWKRAPPNSWNRFRDFLFKIERIWSLFENDPLALKARRAKPAGGGARGGERGGACGARLLRRIGGRVWRLAVLPVHLAGAGWVEFKAADFSLTAGIWQNLRLWEAGWDINPLNFSLLPLFSSVQKSAVGALIESAPTREWTTRGSTC